MIEKVRIRGYRKFRDLTFEPHKRFNILVGENESGKSTLLEAVGLALTGRIRGRTASEELNPYWFNRDDVFAFFAARAAGQHPAPPEITIEVFLEDRDEFARNLYGANNSDEQTRSCPGVCLHVFPNTEYSREMEQHLSSGTAILPVEYYKVEWTTFQGTYLTARPKDLRVAVIDSRTIRSSNGVDYYLRQILDDHLTPEERATVSLAFRQVKEQVTTEHLAEVNRRMADLEGALDDKHISLAMDQSAHGAWDSSVVPHVDDIPFALVGQGQQAAIKIALAMDGESGSANVVVIEEPENHLSHTSLNVLIRRLQDLAAESQQLFITTHSSFVLNRLGLDGLQLITSGCAHSFAELSPETAGYFRKLPGYDTLRMVLAERLVLVEGPSDEMLFERFYADSHDGRRPIQNGIDVLSMRGLALKRCLELAKVLGKRCAALRDNDNTPVNDLLDDLGDLADGTLRQVFIGDVARGNTLEPQVLGANSDAAVRRVLGVQASTNLLSWMTNNKTEAALRIEESTDRLVAPAYFTQAIEFIDAVDE